MQKRRKAKRMTPPMLATKYSRAEKLDATAANFPALKHFWSKDNVLLHQTNPDGGYLIDSVGTQHAFWEHGWMLDERGYAKYSFNGGPTCPEPFEAPVLRDFMLIGCGRITWTTRALSIGGSISQYEKPWPSGVSWDITRPPNSATPSAFRDDNNYSNPVEFSFSEELSTTTWYTDENANGQPDPNNPGILGCFATVVRPSSGVCDMHWAGRADDPIATMPNPEYEMHPMTAFVGTLQGPYGTLGDDFATGWTTFPCNRFEWSALLYFEDGAPTDVEEAMRWMAQYNDGRMYPGWKGKK